MAVDRLFEVIYDELRRRHRGSLQRGDLKLAAPLLRASAPKVIYQHLSHGAGRESQEVGAVFGADSLPVEELQIGLVHNLGRSQGAARPSALSPSRPVTRQCEASDAKSLRLASYGGSWRILFGRGGAPFQKKQSSP